MQLRTLARLALTVAAGATVTACGGATAAAGATTTVTTTDTTCEVADTSFEAGPLTLAVTNEGSQVTEVYVYGPDDRVMGEVEDIGPGTSRDLEVELGGGDYEVACKPGQTGDGIRTPIEVSGAAAAQPSPSAHVTVHATDYEFSGLGDATIASGDTVAFTLVNDGQLVHELEVLGPDGGALGEVGPTDPGDDGVVTLSFDEPGAYRVVCRIDDHEQQGMYTTLTVTG